MVQVMGGQEAKVKALICARSKSQRLPIKSCYVPEYEVSQKHEGEWQRIRKLLIPGYVFVETTDPAALAKLIRTLLPFTRMLGVSNDSFIPLTSNEVSWINGFANAEHVVEVSVGAIEGDQVIVTSGPLKGHEAQITKIDRHKRIALLEVHMFGRRKTVKVGLEVVKKS